MIEIQKPEGEEIIFDSSIGNEKYKEIFSSVPENTKIVAYITENGAVMYDLLVFNGVECKDMLVNEKVIKMGLFSNEKLQQPKIIVKEEYKTSDLTKTQKVLYDKIMQEFDKIEQQVLKMKFSKAYITKSEVDDLSINSAGISNVIEAEATKAAVLAYAKATAGINVENEAMALEVRNAIKTLALDAALDIKKDLTESIKAELLAGIAKNETTAELKKRIKEVFASKTFAVDVSPTKEKLLINKVIKAGKLTAAELRQSLLDAERVSSLRSETRDQFKQRVDEIMQKNVIYKVSQSGEIIRQGHTRYISAGTRAEALARYATIKSENLATAEVYKRNSDIIQGYEWLAQLDNRTDIICELLNGRKFLFNELDVPPIHTFCRCTVVPYYKSSFSANNTRGATMTKNNFSLTEIKWSDNRKKYDLKMQFGQEKKIMELRFLKNPVLYRQGSALRKFKTIEQFGYEGTINIRFSEYAEAEQAQFRVIDSGTFEILQFASDKIVMKFNGEILNGEWEINETVKKKMVEFSYVKKIEEKDDILTKMKQWAKQNPAIDVKIKSFMTGYKKRYFNLMNISFDNLPKQFATPWPKGAKIPMPLKISGDAFEEGTYTDMHGQKATYSKEVTLDAGNRNIFRGMQIRKDHVDDAASSVKGYVIEDGTRIVKGKARITYKALVYDYDQAVDLINKKYGVSVGIYTKERDSGDENLGGIVEYIHSADEISLTETPAVPMEVTKVNIGHM